MAQSELAAPPAALHAAALDGETIRALEERFALREEEDGEIWEFLGRHPELVPLLIETSERLPAYLPSDRKPVLYLLVELDIGWHDAEFIEEEADDDPLNHATLFVLAQVPHEEHDAQERLARFWEEWFRPASRHKTSLVTIGVDRL